MRPTSVTSFVLCLLGSNAIAQVSVPTIETPYVVDSGSVSAPVGAAAVTIGFLVDIPNAPWMRLHFSDVDLAGAAILRIVSLQDGAVQTHSRRTIVEWERSSAYFNGAQVWVEVLAQPGTGASRVRLESVTSEVAVPPPPSQCGATDDRVLSTNPRVARLQPSICTGFLVNHCSHAILTAGHCMPGVQVVEFNVPISSPGGNLVHPSPSNQYAIDALSRRSRATSNGDDWAIFGCFANPNTGKTPFEAQMAAFSLQSPPPLDSALMMRVTGCGTDLTPPDHNFAQQTHTGPYFGLGAGYVQYQVDTTSGNSGSPVILESTGAVVAIHTTGNCDAGPSGANGGTSVSNQALQAALNSPQGVLSCTGAWSTYCVAQVNSQGCTPAIGATGTPRASGGPGSFTIRAVNVRNQQNGALFYGINATSMSFQGGTLCVATPLVRTPIQSSGGNTTAADCSGVQSFDMGARIASGIDPRLHAGATLFAQFWQRDPAGQPYPTALTDAIRFTIGP